MRLMRRFLNAIRRGSFQEFSLLIRLTNGADDFRRQYHDQDEWHGVEEK